MKYFQIKPIVENSNIPFEQLKIIEPYEPASRASSIWHANAFERINKLDAPAFKLLNRVPDDKDIYRFVGGVFSTGSLLVSKKFLDVIVDFNIGKIKHWKTTIEIENSVEREFYVIQMFENINEKIIDYSASEFVEIINYTKMGDEILINSYSDYEEMNELLKPGNVRIGLKSLSLKSSSTLDFFRLYFPANGYFVSKELQEELEKNQVKGIDYIPLSGPLSFYPATVKTTNRRNLNKNLDDS